MFLSTCQLSVVPLLLLSLHSSLHSLFLVSMMIVTGPSLSSATFMSAPNSPVATSLPSVSLILLQKYSYIGMAISCFAALIHDGYLSCNLQGA